MIRLLKGLFILLVAGFFYFSFKDEIKPIFSNIFKDRGLHTAEKLEHFVESVKSNLSNGKINAPAPLIKKGDNATLSNTALNIDAVVSFTNGERVKAGLPPLKQNSKLSIGAKNKALDMFKKGYFEHESPEGVGPAEVVKNAQYEYITVGENLALGSFKDSKDLVDAWMASPGHRANILGKQYTEIGVSVIYDEYKGEKQWIGVQEFGTPIELCNKPSESEMKKINTESESLFKLKEGMDELRTEIESASTDEENYGNLVKQYNMLVSNYNQNAKELKALSDKYNKVVREFNTCIDKITN